MVASVGRRGEEYAYGANKMMAKEKKSKKLFVKPFTTGTHAQVWVQFASAALAIADGDSVREFVKDATTPCSSNT
jgi:hypothetical protein